MDLSAHEPLFGEFRRLSALAATASGPGRVTTLGWDLEYAAADCLPSFLDQIVFRRLNDFIAGHDRPVILDCGANIGVTTLHYKRLYPKAQITAFEPDPLFAPILRRNLARNGASDVQVVESAAWTRTGTAPWITEGRDGSRLAVNRDAGTVAVSTVDLAEYLAGGVDLLKLDVEGAEFELLPHLAPHLEAVQNVVVEVHITDQSRYVQLARLLDTLAGAGFEVALNTYGAWRDLIRRHRPAALHAEQYMLLAGWRGDPAGLEREPNQLPYIGLDLCAELADARHRATVEPFLREAGRVLADVTAGTGGWDVTRIDGHLSADAGHCVLWRCPDGMPSGDAGGQQASPTLVLEDGLVLGPGHAQHDDIRRLGRGRYSHWGRQLYLSASDNSDPRDNGRIYTVVSRRPSAA